MDRRHSDKHLSSPKAEKDSTVEIRALALCKFYGAGSNEYAKFLEEVNSTLLGSMLALPKFVPGDVKSSAATKQRRKKKRQSKQKPQQNGATPKALANVSPFATQSAHEEVSDCHELTSGGLERVEEEVERRGPQDLPQSQADEDAPGRVVLRSMTTDERRGRKPTFDASHALRRTHSSLVAEQTTMDEQVALQLQTLVHEKAELIKENSRLKNENEGLKTLLEYATCEATADDGEESDYDETTKETLRQPGIQAWHPLELQSPTSYSSYGILGSTSSTEDKDQRVSSQASEDTFNLLHVRT